MEAPLDVWDPNGDVKVSPMCTDVGWCVLVRVLPVNVHNQHSIGGSIGPPAQPFGP